MTINPPGPNCQRLQAQLEKAQARIAALEAELRRSRRQAAPFSRDEPKSDSQPPGRRPGQGPFRVRKTGGCNKTARGARTHAVLASVLQTLKQQGREALDYLTSVLTAPAQLPKLLAPPVFDTS